MFFSNESYEIFCRALEHAERDTSQKRAHKHSNGFSPSRLQTTPESVSNAKYMPESSLIGIFCACLLVVENVRIWYS